MPAKDKIVKTVGYHVEGLSFQVIGEKIREEEDKKTIQGNKKQVNCKSVKAIANSSGKPAQAKASTKTGARTTKSTNSIANNSKMN